MVLVFSLIKERDKRYHPRSQGDEELGNSKRYELRIRFVDPGQKRLGIGGSKSYVLRNRPDDERMRVYKSTMVGVVHGLRQCDAGKHFRKHYFGKLERSLQPNKRLSSLSVLPIYVGHLLKSIDPVPCALFLCLRHLRFQILLDYSKNRSERVENIQNLLIRVHKHINLHVSIFQDHQVLPFCNNIVELCSRSNGYLFYLSPNNRGRLLIPG
mmetsp:Transcript_8771/g.12808  ORF Transcript_8771/g.12808 Transcript_8771/m.12808 type:complete len:212 (-) Transcript_8771:323-958(-)